MAIDVKLDEEWARNQTADAVVELRGVMEAAYNDMLDHKARIDRIVAGAQFTAVDAEIKTEGQAVRAIINDAVTDFGTHLVFLNWRPPN